MKQNTTIDLQTKTRPIRSDKGDVLTDVDFARQALEKIDNYTKQNNTPPKINPKFVAWLRAGVDYVDKGQGTMAQYKESHVIKEIEDYDLVCANTAQRNAKLERKGEFESHIVQKVKGVAK